MSVVYKVLEKAFIDGVLYDPATDRNHYVKDKPFAAGKVPKHLELVKVDPNRVVKSQAKKAAEKKAHVGSAQKDLAGASLLAKNPDFSGTQNKGTKVTTL